MKKVGQTLYNKLYLQAQEAKEQGLETNDSSLITLSHAINEAIGPFPEETDIYSYDDLKNDVYSNVWKTITAVSVHHNVNSLDAGKLNSFASDLSEDIINKIKEKMDLSLKNTKEPKVIGEE